MKSVQRIGMAAARRLVAPLRYLAWAGLALWEPVFLRGAGPVVGPPLFIVGAPRVGSTLLYQAIVRRFQTSYFCNAAAAFPKSPATVTAILAAARGIAPPDDFSSVYGATRGWNAPAQAREIWGRWFPPDQAYVGPGRMPPATILEIRQTVARVALSCGRPFVSKSQGHAVRIQPLYEAFPTAVFIRIHRNHADVAASILRGRRECFGDESFWFSAKPSTYAAIIGLPPHAQVEAQIKGIEDDMDRDFAAADPERVFDIAYESFCEAPREHLEQIRLFYRARTGVELGFRCQVPAAFTASGARAPGTVSTAPSVC